MENPLSSSSIQERAVQMGMPPLSPGAVLLAPVYQEEFVSEQFPEMNGPVRIRFSNIEDEILIAGDVAVDGGTLEARVYHSIRRCCEAAPKSWYSPGENDPTPVINLRKHYDFAELVALYTRWIKWRATFRRDNNPPNTPQTDQP